MTFRRQVEDDPASSFSNLYSLVLRSISITAINFFHHHTHSTYTMVVGAFRASARRAAATAYKSPHAPKYVQLAFLDEGVGRRSTRRKHCVEGAFGWTDGSYGRQDEDRGCLSAHWLGSHASYWMSADLCCAVSTLSQMSPDGQQRTLPTCMCTPPNVKNEP